MSLGRVTHITNLQEQESWKRSAGQLRNVSLADRSRKLARLEDSYITAHATVREMVEAGGVGIFMGIENTQVIDFSRRQKHRKRQNCGQRERIWNAAREKEERCSRGVVTTSE